MVQNLMNGLFGKVEDGLCRLSTDGRIAVKVNGQYKSYNIDTGRLTNCDGFAFDIGSEMFFVVPTSHVEVGDIILVNHKPRCVRSVEDGGNDIVVINYADSTIEHILPERHVFMGNTYFYGKIVSMFGDFFKGGKKNKKGANMILKYYMMSSMLGQLGGGSANSIGNSQNNIMSGMLPLMLMSGGSGIDNMFGGMFDFFDGDDTDDDTDTKGKGEE